MDVHLTLPEYGKENKNVKDLIMSILTYKHPLDIATIHKELKYQYKIEVSYQAVHKIIKQLIVQEVIEYNNKKAELSKDWIKAVVGYCEVLQQYYPETKQKKQNKKR